MTTPYARIIPMHIFPFMGIILGFSGVPAMIGFTLLKTGADVYMHIREHR